MYFFGGGHRVIRYCSQLVDSNQTPDGLRNATALLSYMNGASGVECCDASRGELLARILVQVLSLSTSTHRLD